MMNETLNTFWVIGWTYTPDMMIVLLFLCVNQAVKWSDSATLEVDEGQQKVVVGLGDYGALKKQGKQSSRVADAADYKACRLVNKAVDQDLYEIPPDMLCHKRRVKKACSSPPRK
jgi:hypothetical protein